MTEHGDTEGRGVAAPALRARPRQPLLTGADARRALDAAARILANGVPMAGERASAVAGSIDGYAGALLVADALARAGRQPAYGVGHLLERALVLTPDRLGLYDGAAGLLVVLDVVDPGRTGLAGARARLRAAVAESIRTAEPVELDLPRRHDLIHGVAGRAVGLRGDQPAILPELQAYARRFADAVDARLAAPDPYRAPVDLGVAHGVAGMLAALNAALPHDRVLARRYVELLLATSHRVAGAHRWGGAWAPDVLPPAQRSWCYGTVGIATVLYDRAELDGDDGLRELALAALDGVLDDDSADPAWFMPSLCHGRAGLAALAWHVAAEQPRFAQRARAFAAGVLAEYDERRPLGYRAFDLHDGRGDERTDFLDGAFGIALFLVDAATAGERRWLPLLGILPD